MVNDSRFYYGVGLLIILISFAVFALGFEKRKPRAREIVMLVCMISFAVIGRVIFYMTPQVKPCAAIIIITGIALGKNAGFLTGAMTAFVSNVSLRTFRVYFWNCIWKKERGKLYP